MANVSETGHASMFNNAQNVHIAGGSFNINISNGPLSNVLHKRVAPNAILNAGGRADEVRCHPGTRGEVIERIEKWGKAQDGEAAPIFWLSGPAGAGKSAIMQTVAERCDQQGVPPANFFFFRGDTSRAHVSPLIPTLLYQIIQAYPSLHDTVATVLSANPLIFDSASPADQLAQLIITPLDSVQRSSLAYRPLLILIDGLDECDSESKRSQQKILDAFDKALAGHHGPCPFRLLVASRDEPQICTAFNKISSQCTSLYLSDKYSPEKDIRVFVTAQFEQIKEIHPLRHMLDTMWPSVQDINYIVEKSSGQFIYAATVMRFILDSSASPMVSLERVQGAMQLARKSPFPHLDAIYTYILSRVDDQVTLKDILCAQIVSQETPGLWIGLERSAQTKRKSRGVEKGRHWLTLPVIDLLESLHPRYNKAIVLSCLQDLTPLAVYDLTRGALLFHHASFSDYLLDQSRSQDYFVDTAAFIYKYPLEFWERADKRYYDHDTRAREWAWVAFGVLYIMKLQKLPPGLMSLLASLTQESVTWSRVLSIGMSIFVKLYNLCTSDDDITNFRHIFREWLYTSYWKWEVDDFKAIPFSSRYFQMARAKRLYDKLPGATMIAALRAESDFDRQESAAWLRELLHDIRNRECYHDRALYGQLLKAWISWAVENDIPCNGLSDIPDSQWYIWTSVAEKWATRPLKLVLNLLLGGSRQ